mgnify:CR=1 FL=1
MSHQAAHNLPHDQLLNAYWVVPGRLLAGPYPSAPALPDAQKQVAALLALGIDYIVDLTEPGEYGLRAYWPLLLEASMAQGLTIERRQWSIPDMSVPTQEQMRATLDDIDAALASGRTVYIHCFGGIGRTGTVVGCYLVRGGARGDDALATIAHLRRTIHQPYRRAPETSEQRAMVRAWHEGVAGD